MTERIDAAWAVTDAKATGSPGGASRTARRSVSSCAVSGRTRASGASSRPRTSSGGSVETAGHGRLHGAGEAAQGGRVGRETGGRVPGRVGRVDGHAARASRAREEGAEDVVEEPFVRLGRVDRRKAGVGAADGRRPPPADGPTRTPPQPGEGGFGGGEEARILGESHDLERLLDRRREPAEGQAAALVEQLLEDLDQDGDADRVDDLRLLRSRRRRLTPPPISA